MEYLTVKEASRKLGVKERTVTAWIRELREKEPHTYSTYILTRPHRFNKSLVTYTLAEELVNEWRKSHIHTPHTYSHTYFSEPPEREKTQQETTGQDNIGQPVFNGVLTEVIKTLQGEIERQGETIKQMLQDHAKERERTDIIIMQLRADIMKLLPEGEGKQAEPPEIRDQDKTPEKPEGEKKPADYQFSFGDRLWFIGQDIKRILNKRIF